MTSSNGTYPLESMFKPYSMAPCRKIQDNALDSF